MLSISSIPRANSRVKPPVLFLPVTYSGVGLADQWEPFREWIVSVVYRGRHLLHKGRRGVPLYCLVLRDVIPRSAPKLVQQLVDAKVLIRVAGPRKGAATRFTLAETHFDAPHWWVPVTDVRLRRKLEAHREQADRLSAHFKGLREQFARLTVEVGHADDCIQLAWLAAGDPYTIVDKTAGRLHTPLTALPRVLRHHVLADGERLVQVDMSHAQPLLLGAFLVGHGVETGDVSERRKREKRDPICWQNRVNKLELATYLGHCCRGELYDLLAERAGVGRNRAKRELLSALYDSPENLYRYRAGLAFAKSFPSVWAAVVQVHEEFGRGHLARELQRL